MTRLSPSESATLYSIGTIKYGKDEIQQWVVVKTSNGIKRWTKYESVKLNGFQALTVEYLTKNIGKLLEIYLCEYNDMWPTSKNFSSRIYFLSTGNAHVNRNKNPIVNWLRTKRPAIKDNTIFSIEGYIGWYKKDKLELSSLQVDSLNKTLVSTNVLNTRAFVKIE